MPKKSNKTSFRNKAIGTAIDLDYRLKYAWVAMAAYVLGDMAGQIATRADLIAFEKLFEANESDPESILSGIGELSLGTGYPGFRENFSGTTVLTSYAENCVNLAAYHNDAKRAVDDKARINVFNSHFTPNAAACIGAEFRSSVKDVNQNIAIDGLSVLFFVGLSVFSEKKHKWLKERFLKNDSPHSKGPKI